jgi:hypothetical protein
MAATLNPYISNFDEGFDVEHSSAYRMTIQCALGGFSFALLDDEKRCLIGLECHQADCGDTMELFQLLERALDAKGLSNRVLKSVTCLIDGRTNLIIPETLAQEDHDKFLNFTFRIPEGYIQQTERIETIHAVNAFAYPKTLRDMILGKWKEAKITHCNSVFLKSCFEYAPEGKVVFVNVHNRDFDLVIVNDGNLLFYNNFQFNTKADFAYFLLFALEQNHISGTEVPVCFSGLILPNSEIIELCNRYLKYLLFIEDRHVLQVSQALEDVPYQYYHLHYQALR